MDLVVVFALGVIIGFIVAWILVQSLLQPTRRIFEQYGALDVQLRSLTETTSQLQRILADRSYRGKWGEKRALEVLALAGFERDKHFKYQTASKTGDGKRIIPDITFEFPNKIFLHMDSKFPLDQYEAYIESDDERARQQHLNKFLKAVRSHVKDLDVKGYVSSGQGTVSYVLLFIPFESLFRFIHEQDTKIIDDALSRRVVMCSPLTLYVLLATIRQSIDTFAYGQAASEIHSTVEQLKHEWDKYSDELGKVGERLQNAQAAYDNVATTRRTKLSRAFDQVERVTDEYRTIRDE